MGYVTAIHGMHSCLFKPQTVLGQLVLGFHIIAYADADTDHQLHMSSLLAGWFILFTLIYANFVGNEMPEGSQWSRAKDKGKGEGEDVGQGFWPRNRAATLLPAIANVHSRTLTHTHTHPHTRTFAN